MINLSEKRLPNTVSVGGSFFTINTDFREWLKFDKLIKQDTFSLADFVFLFPGDLPLITSEEQVQELIKTLMDFFINPNSTPNDVTKKSDDVILDYQQDGEYIYSAFRQVYGINLLKEDMHWHEFKALIVGLPDNCKLSQIMHARGYRKDERKTEQLYEENKRRWQLPRKKVSDAVIKQLQEDFYDS